MKKTVIAPLILLMAVFFAWFFYSNSLTYKIQKNAFAKKCTVNIAVIKDGRVWTANNKKVPLMSVFKYFVALKVLDKIEKENLSINDKILVTEDMIIKNTYSPMLKKYNKTPFSLTISDLTKYMVSQSDNNATDILLSYVGGISKVQEYLNNIGFSDIHISADEKMMEADIKNQYINQSTPLDVIRLMKMMHESSILSKASIAFLDKIMMETITGEDKLKAGLPKGTVFGHKTGMSSRKPDGIRIAENDAGFVILPNGEIYYIAVFVSESKMSDKENTALIAPISKIVYEHFAKLK